MKRILIVLFLMIGLNLYSEELMSYNMWKDKEWNYVITLDEKWQMKMQEARQMGMDNFFIPKGYSMNNAPAGIMAYVGDGFNSIEEFAKDDLENFISHNQGYTYEIINNDIKNEKNDHIMYRVYNPVSPVMQYISYFGNGGSFFFALALQLFEHNDEYISDFYTSSEESCILDFKYNIQ